MGVRVQGPTTGRAARRAPGEQRFEQPQAAPSSQPTGQQGAEEAAQLQARHAQRGGARVGHALDLRRSGGVGEGRTGSKDEREGVPAGGVSVRHALPAAAGGGCLRAEGRDCNLSSCRVTRLEQVEDEPGGDALAHDVDEEVSQGLGGG